MRVSSCGERCCKRGVDSRTNTPAVGSSCVRPVHAASTQRESIGPACNVCHHQQRHRNWQSQVVNATAAAVIAVSLAAPASAAALDRSPFLTDSEPFLTATGAQGILRDQEAELFKLRKEVEGEVRQELDKAREELEKDGRASQIGKLCATPFGVDIVGITQVVALIGALVGGISARQRKDELERLNEQLRKINMGLRQQARAGTIYAPGLTYLPATGAAAPAFVMPPAQQQQPQQQQEEQQQQQQVPPSPLTTDGDSSDDDSNAIWAASVTSNVDLSTISSNADRPFSMQSLASIDEEFQTTEQRQCIKALREGKRLLKEQSGAPAMIHFEKALMLAKFLGNKVSERRAVRGLAAASRLQGQFQSAVNHLQRVLEISGEMGDHVGDADAFGTIADIYTDMGDLESAAKNYDKYISAMATDGPV